MEGQNFKIPEDPSQTLPGRSAYGPNLVDLFLGTFHFPGKKGFLAAILANICLRNSQANLGLDAAYFFCSPQTSFDEINDGVVKSERGELVRVSDPLLVYSAHATAGDLWRVPIRLLLKTHLAAGV